jgi:hypothetical protein
LRCVESLLAAAVAFGALGAGEGETPLHETVGESGVRIVVAAPAASQDDGVIEVAVALPFGWADDRSPAGRGLATLAATFATHVATDPPRFTAEVRPTTTLLLGRATTAELEKELAPLVERLTATTCETELFDAVVAKCVAPTAGALDRFRETAAPRSAEGLGAWGVQPRKPAWTKEEMLSFLAARCGSEGCVVVLVSKAPPGPLSLAAGRAFAKLGRARGVAPPFVREPEAAASRRVAPPAGSSDGCVGWRLAWCDDPQGDRVALAAAFLAQVAQRAPTIVERDRQGGVVAFVGADAATLAPRLAAAVASLASQPLDEAKFAALVDALAAEARDAQASAALQARRLAQDGAECGRPGASSGCAARWRAAGLAAAEAALRQQLRAEGRVEVVAPSERAGS